MGNALREAFEESGGLLFKTPAERFRVGQELSDGQYHLRVSVESDSKVHVTFVKILDLPDDLEELFLSTRAYLTCFTRRRRNVTKERDGWVQKQQRNDHPHPPNAYCEDHPGLRTITRRSGRTERVVNEDFIEKIELAWIPLSLLKRATEIDRERSCGSDDILLRPLFAVVAKAIVNQFQQHPEPKLESAKAKAATAATVATAATAVTASTAATAAKVA